MCASHSIEKREGRGVEAPAFLYALVSENTSSKQFGE